MNPPLAIGKYVVPFLTLLSKKICGRGFTELEVEQALSWERGHIQQLTAGLKDLKVAEVLQILGVIGVEPKAFLIESYGTPPRSEVSPAELAELSTLVDSLANLLVKHQVVTAGELARAVARQAGKDLLPEAEAPVTEASEAPESHAERVDAGANRR